MMFRWRPAPREDLASEGAPPAKPFYALTEANRQSWTAVIDADAQFVRGLPGWLMDNLAVLRSDCHGFAIDRLEHCLQTATRAHRDGRDEEYVTCALFHDVGAALAPDSHAEFVALILRPYVSERNHWMLLHHGVFQSYYFAHFHGGDRNARRKFRRHPHYDYTAEFCDLYDQAAFDPNYPSMTLDEFRPMVERVLGRRRG